MTRAALKSKLEASDLYEELAFITFYLVIVFSGGLKVKRQQFWQLFGLGFIGDGVSVGAALTWAVCALELGF